MSLEITQKYIEDPKAIELKKLLNVRCSICGSGPLGPCFVFSNKTIKEIDYKNTQESISSISKVKEPAWLNEVRKYVLCDKCYSQENKK